MPVAEPALDEGVTVGHVGEDRVEPSRFSFTGHALALLANRVPCAGAADLRHRAAIVLAACRTCLTTIADRVRDRPASRNLCSTGARQPAFLVDTHCDVRRFGFRLGTWRAHCRDRYRPFSRTTGGRAGAPRRRRRQRRLSGHIRRSSRSREPAPPRRSADGRRNPWPLLSHHGLFGWSVRVGRRLGRDRLGIGMGFCSHCAVILATGLLPRSMGGSSRPRSFRTRWVQCCWPQPTILPDRIR